MKNEPKMPSAALSRLMEVAEHEINSIRVVMHIWHEEIPDPVKRSIAKRIRKLEYIVRRMRVVSSGNLHLPFRNS